MSGPTDWNLVTPFLTDDPVFAYGVEFGMLYQKLKSFGDADFVLHDQFHRENQDRILVMASRLGIKVVEIKEVDADWFTLTLEREGA